MSGALEWPATALITPRGKRELQAEYQRQLALEAQRRTPAPDASTRHLAVLERRVADLEKRLAKAEKSLAVTVPMEAIADVLGKMQADLYDVVSYRGTWHPEKSYPRGTLITHQGGGWISDAATVAGERPGGCARWKLAIKSGAKP